MAESTKDPAVQRTETVVVMAAEGEAVRTYVRARDTDGQFMPLELRDSAELKRAKRKTQSQRRHLLTERDYLKSMARALDTKDVRNVVLAVVRDAVDGEEKCRNAAREWLGKYALGGGKQSLDLILHPEVIQGKR